jgi:hypothetical protein
MIGIKIDKSKGDLIYIVNGKMREIIMEQQPFALLHERRKELLRHEGFTRDNLIVAGWRTRERLGY